MKKKAPKKKAKGYAYGTDAVGVMPAGTPEQDLSKAKKYAGKKKGKFGDYASDYASIMGDTMLSTIGLPDVIDNQYKTELGTKTGDFMNKYVNPVAGAAGKVAMNMAAPGLGAVASAVTGAANAGVKNKRTAKRSDETDEMYQLRMIREGEMDDQGFLNTAGGNQLLSSAMQYGTQFLKNGGLVDRLANGVDVGEEPKKKFTVSASTGQAHMQRGKAINSDRALLDAALRKKLGLKDTDPLGDQTLSIEEVNAIAPNYYKNVKAAKEYYNTNKSLPRDAKGNFITDYAGTGEPGTSIEETVYGPRHRAVVYPSSATILIDPKKKPVAMPVDTTIAPILGQKDGGEVVGAGTSRSDSINAKVEKGAFVVPAENAGVAKQIRKEVLGENPNEIANLNQGGGVPVKLSDGEELFTKAEKEFLIKAGIDITKLAPNAKTGVNKAAGGEVDDGGEDLTALLKKLDEQEAKLKEKEKQAKIEQQKEADSEKKASVKFAMSRAIEKEQQRLTKIKAGIQKDLNAPRGYDVGDMKRRVKDYLDEEKKSEGVYDSKNYKSSVGGGAHYSPPKADVKKEVAVSPEVVKKGTDIASEIQNEQSDAVAAGAIKNPIAAPIKKWADIAAEIDANAKPVSIPKATTGGTKSAKTRTPGVATEGGGLMETLPMQRGVEKYPEPTISGTASEVPSLLVDERRGAEKKPRFTPNIEDIFGAAQTGLGLYSLLKDGKRPEDSIDPDFTAAVEKAKADAAYGLSPSNRQLAEQQLLQRARSEEDIIRNLSGGNAGVAMSNLRASSADSARNITSLAASDENLRLQKQRYADALVSQKAGMKRQLFEDKMRAFDMNQAAGADLLGAGIENILGSVRAKREEKFLSTLPTFKF